MNYFQPSVKLVGKERHGSRVHKRYDAPLTPYQRLSALGMATPPCVQDPFALADRITQEIAKIAALANVGVVAPARRWGPPMRALSHRAAMVALEAG